VIEFSASSTRALLYNLFEKSFFSSLLRFEGRPSRRLYTFTVLEPPAQAFASLTEGVNIAFEFPTYLSCEIPAQGYGNKRQSVCSDITVLRLFL